MTSPADNPSQLSPTEIHQQLGALTRQLHDSLMGLGVAGLADKVRDWADELPDAKSRLSYIAKLTGQAAETVLNKVDEAKNQQEFIAAETKRMQELLVKDPVAAVAKGEVMNYLQSMADINAKVDANLTDIMMAQDFHDLTGQVIAKVVQLASTIEEQLVHMLVQTAPPEAQLKASAATGGEIVPALAGPVVDGQTYQEVVTDQSQVDDLLASLGF
ncbi:protein phosphatase CheZ [Curvibacter sp. CHRR-16]|uniref:protein phosphatase CheZ n=1 Tax=Curvibacter sp. CHRR-16 TaxID=2835872 RepID=UPI001BDA941C|nr:protein phosphatase CheZ [Curvibacter sp. CHRR-16]MBT0569536.1 protein phosphatase CheZ [Curvibacter sp. CHRR-16]